MVVHQSFSDVYCEIGFVIKVINAHYGYNALNRNIRQACSTIVDNCFLSVTLYSSSYYAEILEKCNGKRKCDSSLKAAELIRPIETSCGSSNDYVSVQFYCLPSDEESKYNQIIYFKKFIQNPRARL